MFRNRNDRFYRWELALLLGIALALLSGAWLSGQNAALAEKVVRLHVVGASNSEEDQAVKLEVRDAVLALVKPMLEGTADQEKAMSILADHLGELAAVGARVSGERTTASVEQSAWFPTKEYNDFALPAGRYPALKIVLGEGEGQNWWCVVFPLLCAGSVTEAAQETEAFSREQINLITGESAGYLVRFKAIELWDQWMERLDCKK